MPHKGLQTHGFSSFPATQSIPKSPSQIKCEADGGTWDSQNKICIPKEKPTTQPKPRPGEVIRDAETGEPKGFINSKGDFVRARREDIQNVASRRAARLSPIEGGQVFSERVQAENIEEQQRILQETGAPVRRELDPTLGPQESIPVFGPMIIKARKKLFPFLEKTAFL